MRKAFILLGLLFLLSACTETAKEDVTVLFDSNGGTTVEALVIEQGSSIVEPSSPTKEGYTFLGWYIDSDLISTHTFSSVINEDITLYAKWEVNVYHLIFIDDDETVIQESEYNFGADLSSHNPPVLTSEEGYTFTGWDINMPNTMPAYDVTIQAQYDINSHQVIFKDYDDSTIQTLTYVYGSDLSTLEQANPVREGYTFTTWSDVLPRTMPDHDITMTAQYSINSYQVIFKDFDDSTIQTLTYEYGSDLSTLEQENPVREGYTFTAWSAVLPSTMPDYDITMTAQYHVNQYSMSFYDYDDTLIEEKTVDYGSDLSTLTFNEPARTGYLFTGWDTTLPTTMPANQMVFHAEYTIQSFILKYIDYDETILYTHSFTFNESLDSVTVSEPTRVGYTFLSWSEVLPSMMPGFDITISAQYSVNQYTLSFYDYDDTLIEEKTVDYGSDLSTLTINEPTRVGYQFIEWDTTIPTTMPDDDITCYAIYDILAYDVKYVDYNEMVLFEESFDYEASLSAVDVEDPMRYGYTFIGWDTALPEAMPAYDITVYAQYTINTHTISFYDYDDSLISQETYDYGEDLTTMSTPHPERIGYTFVSWNHTVPATMPDENLSFEVVYEAVTYNLYYTLYDAENGSNPSTYTIESDTIIFDDPIKEGYTFEGWYDNDSFEGTPITEIASGSTGDVGVYAKWVVIVYQITYDLDGGTNGANPDSYHIDTNTIILDSATKEGYSFLGWYDNDGFTGTPITDIASGSTGDVSLYANWEINQYDFTYITYEDYDPLNDIVLSTEEDVIMLALGDAHTIALTSEGRVISWGFNLYGQLGDQSGIERYDPKDVTGQFNLQGEEKIIWIAAGDNCSMVLTSLGRVFTFGENSDGQLGDGTTTYKNTPTDITTQFGLPSGEIITAVYMGGDNAAAITSLGRVFAWGDNSQQQLVDGTQIDHSTPLDITSQLVLNPNETVSMLAIENKHYMLYTSSNRVFSWGYNSSGQVGNGSITTQETPLDITAQFSFSEGEDVISIATGELHAALVTSTGRLFMWGENMYGQLGDGTTIDKNTPTDITLAFMYEFEFNEKINQVSLTEASTVITTSFGSIYAWGRNNNGQVGDGTVYQRNTPVEITSFFNLDSGETVDVIASGLTHNIAITSKNSVYGWGNNSFGQIGDGTTVRRTSPTALPFIGVYDKTTYYIEYAASLTPDNPTRSGYTLDGWYIDDTYTTAYVFTTMPAEDVTVYGKWMSEE